MNANLRLIVVVAIGAVIGSVLNTLLAHAGAPHWMTNVLPMGLPQPFVLDVSVLRLTFGFMLNMSFAMVIGMLIALWAFQRLK